MKKAVNGVLCVILCLAVCTMLFSCSSAQTSEEESTTSLAQSLGMTDFSVLLPFDENGNELCGVFYLGVGKGDEAANKAEIFKKYFSSIDTDTLDSIKTFSTIGGDECYFIVPKFTGTVDLNVLELDENGQTHTAGMLAQNLKKPFVLKCNASDLFPDVEITLTSDSGEKLTFSPRLSLESGKLLTVQGIADFTDYEASDFSGQDSGGEEPSQADKDMMFELVCAHIYNMVDNPEFVYDGSPEFFWDVMCAAVSAAEESYINVDTGKLVVPADDVKKYAESLFKDGEMQPILGVHMDAVSYDMESDSYIFTHTFSNPYTKVNVADFSFSDGVSRMSIELQKPGENTASKWNAVINKSDKGFGYVIDEVTKTEAAG